MDMKILRGHGIAALAGAGGALLTQGFYGWEPVRTYFADKPGYMALAQFLLGITLGRGIYHFEAAGEHPAAYGFVGQVSGSAAAGGAMMLYNQYMPASAPESTAPPVEGLGYTGVRQVAPYYDRYKVSVPRGTSRAVNGLGSGGRGRSLSGEEVTQANYFQTNGINGLGEDESVEADEGQPGWPADDASPDVGTWIG
jgi:hypothetical protein